MEKINLKYSSITLDDDGIIWVRFETEDGVMDIEEMKDQIEAVIKLTKGKPHLFIVDGRDNYANLTKEARQYAAKHPEMAKIRIAQALVVNKLPNRITANAFIKINKPPNPVKVFNDIQKAKEWLKKFKK